MTDNSPHSSRMRIPDALTRRVGSGQNHGIELVLGEYFFYGPVAQLVEQRIENPRVGGSIPSRPTYYLNRRII